MHSLTASGITVTTSATTPVAARAAGASVASTATTSARNLRHHLPQTPATNTNLELLCPGVYQHILPRLAGPSERAPERPAHERQRLPLLLKRQPGEDLGRVVNQWEVVGGGAGWAAVAWCGIASVGKWQGVVSP